MRENVIWQLPIDDLLKANLPCVHELYRFFLDGSVNPANNRVYTDLNLT
jgi:hypothetical protein